MTDMTKQTEALREAQASEAKEQPAPVAKPRKQEPVAWRTFDGEGGYDYRTYDMNENYAKEWDKQNPKHKGWVEPLYTSPPASKPLTEEEIERCMKQAYATVQGRNLERAFARAIEAAQGIKEKNT